MTGILYTKGILCIMVYIVQVLFFLMVHFLELEMDLYFKIKWFVLDQRALILQHCHSRVSSHDCNHDKDISVHCSESGN